MTTLYTEQTKNVTKTWLLITFFIFVIFFGSTIQARAQEKTYNYKNIDFVFTVNEDSTVDVIEKETFDFQGNFHNAFRDLLLNKVDDITDIQVIDAETNLPIPFTVSHQNGEKKIEWHYDLTDTIHTWILKYKLHGAISFLKDHDEFYWNLLTDFSVPIDDVTAKVLLPREVDPNLLTWSLYNSNITHHTQDDLFSHPLDGKTFFFEVKNIPPFESITIAPGWPKGLVSQTAYFRDAIFTWWPIILSFILLFISIVFAFIYWFKTEKWRKGRGTIVPQYEPPQNFPPAIAEVLVKESVSKKTWPATLIDLAVRGYVTIEEDKPSFFSGNATRKPLFIIIIFVLFFEVFSDIFPIFPKIVNGLFSAIIFIAPLVVLFIFRWSKNYIVKRKKEDDINLKDFEKKYLQILFPSFDSSFSTKEMKKSQSKAREMYLQIKELEKDLYKEVDVDTNAYENKISKEKVAQRFLGFIFIFIWIAIVFSGSIGGLIGVKFFILIIAVFISALIITWFVKFEARLSREGAVMREDWLGFKMYLETAERYRMQNLTPELFEKYLPYAIIFGIEKKWAKAFESLNMNPPSWYGAYGGYSAGSSIGSFSGSRGFSVSAFSSSLSSSFASAMGSSGASGASGGGGGAGGGGGGGGGGAS